MYQKADRILVDQAPILPLDYGRNHLLVKPLVKVSHVGNEVTVLEGRHHRTALGR